MCLSLHWILLVHGFCNDTKCVYSEIGEECALFRLVRREDTKVGR